MALFMNMNLREVQTMSEITIRTATPDDSGMLLGIYKYYIENTAITYELEVPTVDVVCHAKRKKWETTG